MATTEINAAPATVEVPAADPTPAETAVATTGEAKKKVAKPKAPRKPSNPSHPKYFEMISEAISSLKEKTGSSQFAITKFIEGKHGVKLPPNFKKIILVHLRKLTAGGKLTKIKNSFKLPSKTNPRAATSKPKSAATTKTKLATVTKSKSTTAKSKPKTKVKSAMSSKPKPKSVANPKSAPVKLKSKVVAPKPKVQVRQAKVAKKSVKDTPSKKKPAVPVKKTVLAKVKASKAPAKKAVKKGKPSPVRKVLARKVK